MAKPIEEAALAGQRMRPDVRGLWWAASRLIILGFLAATVSLLVFALVIVNPPEIRVSAVTAAGTFALGAGGLLSWLESRELVRETHELAAATHAQAAAAQAQTALAEVALGDTRADRQLAQMPRVTVELSEGEWHSVKAVIRNAGPGAALNVILCYHDVQSGGRRYFSVFIGDLARESRIETLRPDNTQETVLYRQIVDDLARDTTEGLAAVVYEDSLGTVYRWPASLADKGHPTSWKLSDPDKPAWADALRLGPPQFAVSDFPVSGIA
jgi:hypothetical protein